MLFVSLDCPFLAAPSVFSNINLSNCVRFGYYFIFNRVNSNPIYNIKLTNFDQSTTTGVTSGAGTVYPSGASEFTIYFFRYSICSFHGDML